jgi:hypothetical protein
MKFLPASQQNCDNCYYRRSATEGSDSVNLCCRYAPRPGDLYPAKTPAINWCGEWAPVSQ